MHHHATAEIGLLSPAGFESHHHRPSLVASGRCACGRGGTEKTFLGATLCEGCAEVRSVVAGLLVGLARGMTPEELADGAARRIVLGRDPIAVLERREMLDHADLLMMVAAG
jgi:hypothetical protein